MKRKLSFAYRCWEWFLIVLMIIGALVIVGHKATHAGMSGIIGGVFGSSANSGSFIANTNVITMGTITTDAIFVITLTNNLTTTYSPTIGTTGDTTYFPTFTHDCLLIAPAGTCTVSGTFTDTSNTTLRTLYVNISW